MDRRDIMTEQQASNALIAIAGMIVDSIRKGDPQGRGIPGGTLYAALMAHGCSLEVFQRIMAGLVSAGKLKKVGQLYSVAKGV
jgi:hypothetical protein